MGKCDFCKIQCGNSYCSYSGDTMTDTLEYEFKYLVNHIKLSDFKSILIALSPLKIEEVSSWDTYFVKEGSTDEFQRFRESDKPELTKKVKLKAGNNFQRVESDLALDKNRVTLDQVKFHVSLDGYKQNFRIFKACTIFWFENINVVYYTVLDEELTKLASYAEIEVTKNRVRILGEEVAFELLKDFEKNLEPLGISAQNRLKRSLFEIYRR